MSGSEDKQRWGYFMREARKNKRWAREKATDTAWLGTACDYSKETVVKYNATPTKKLAEDSYQYTKMRANSTFDKPATDLWGRIGRRGWFGKSYEHRWVQEKRKQR